MNLRVRQYGITMLVVLKKCACIAYEVQIALAGVAWRGVTKHVAGAVNFQHLLGFLEVRNITFNFCMSVSLRRVVWQHCVAVYVNVSQSLPLFRRFFFILNLK